MPVFPFQRKRWDKHLSCSFCTEPWGTGWLGRALTGEPVENCFFVGGDPMGLKWRHKFHLPSEQCLGACLFSGSLKSWGTSCMVQPVHCSARSQEWGEAESLAVLGQHLGQSLCQVCVSAFRSLFHVGLFSFATNIETTQLVSGFLPKGVSPHLAAIQCILVSSEVE